MTDLTYVDPHAEDPDDDLVAVQIWLRTAEGAVLFALSAERGPFDDLDTLRAEITAAIPWRIVSRPRTLQQHVVQLPLF